MTPRLALDLLPLVILVALAGLHAAWLARPRQRSLLEQQRQMYHLDIWLMLWTFAAIAVLLAYAARARLLGCP